MGRSEGIGGKPTHDKGSSGTTETRGAGRRRDARTRPKGKGRKKRTHGDVAQAGNVDVRGAAARRPPFPLRPLVFAPSGLRYAVLRRRRLLSPWRGADG